MLIVNKAGKMVWQYGKAGVTGTGADLLNTPVQATYLKDGRVLITDQANARVIMVNMAKKIVWQYGQTGVTGSGADQLNNPNSAELLPNGNILIADEGNNRVIEVTMKKAIAWSDASGLNAPAFASRLPNGHRLIADGGNNRAVEVDKSGVTVWSYDTSARPSSVAAPAPSQAVRLKNGDTLISDQFNHQVIEVTPAGNIIWSYGQIGQAGNAAGMLKAPYGAKVIGDYTGLTPPTGFLARTELTAAPDRLEWVEGWVASIEPPPVPSTLAGRVSLARGASRPSERRPTVTSVSAEGDRIASCRRAGCERAAPREAKVASAPGVGRARGVPA